MSTMDNYNVAMVVEYDGSNFYGFQKQAGGIRTTQGELERALQLFSKQKIDIATSGRTDTGVHALYQVINFKTELKRPSHGWMMGVNSFLPRDVVIRDCTFVHDEFYARYAISRTYHYYLWINPIRPALLNGKVGWFYGKLDIDAMNEALAYLIGELNFSSFRAAGCQANHPVRTMYKANLSVRGDMLRFEFCANAFLYHMVRNMVGALVYVGKGTITIKRFKEIVDSKSRIYAPPTFMPDGLYLVGVEYPEQHFKYTISDWLFQ